MSGDSTVGKPTLVVVVLLWLCAAGVCYGAIYDVFIAHRDAPWTSVVMALAFIGFAVAQTSKHFRSK